jgi:hypothetical protein
VTGTYLILKNKTTGLYVYGEDGQGGEVVESSFVVGKADPVQEGLPTGLGKKNCKNKEENRVSSPENIFGSRMLDGGSGSGTNGPSVLGHYHRRAAQTTGIVKNLVIPLRWSDHGGRVMPTTADLDVLMNHVGPEARCPTGSVKDVLLENSYGNLQVESTVVDWITMDNTESYYADGDSG